MGYVLTFCVGFFVGFVIMSVIAAAGQSDKIQEAYRIGYETGLQHKEEQV